LAEQIRSGDARAAADRRDVVASGCAELDALLPRGGFARGSCVEWIAACAGAGASVLALKVAQAACGEEGRLAVIDEARTFFPPAAAALGVRLENVLVVRPAGASDALWAAEQVFRCGGVSAALVWPTGLDRRTPRRWQLAVERSRALGLLVRSEEALAEPSWADARLLVQPLATDGGWRRWRLELLHARGGWDGKTVEVTLHHETARLAAERTPQLVPLVPALVDRTALARAAGA